MVKLYSTAVQTTYTPYRAFRAEAKSAAFSVSRCKSRP